MLADYAYVAQRSTTLFVNGRASQLGAAPGTSNGVTVPATKARKYLQPSTGILRISWRRCRPKSASVVSRANVRSQIGTCTERVDAPPVERHLGRNGGGWNGTGITSSAAATMTAHNTTLGAMDFSDYWSVYGKGATFDGEPLDSTAVLVKYTYYGDTDFNGHVNFDDYLRTDNGFNNHLSGWLNGDFDLNGTVNFDDYVLIDLAFNTQSGTLRR
jgi:hypothetical protein